jgi:hypothetical protein
MEWEKYITDLEEIHEGMCIENAATHGITSEDAMKCEIGHELCPDCPLKPKPVVVEYPIDETDLPIAVVEERRRHLWDDGEDYVYYFRYDGDKRSEEEFLTNPRPDLPLIQT